MATRRKKRVRRRIAKAARRRKSAAQATSSIRFPGESREYRAARDRLLAAEVEFRRAEEQLAALRRKLPVGGKLKKDYVFEEQGPDGPRPVRLSQLFSDGKDSLLVYSFMYGPEMARPCPSCTSIIDGFNGQAVHITQRANFAVVAKSPLLRILEFARERGWRNLRLLSSHGNGYNRDYHGEHPEWGQMPMLNVFTRRRGQVHHFWASELLYAPPDRGQEPRHVDMLWPLWKALDLTPEGRGTDWHPGLDYAPDKRACCD
jgi:predicted dithiol-disulfide oxidoreductase (DUF899 family)